MNFTYNSFLKLNDPELRLCNPNGKELAAIHAIDRNFTLRLNDISELSFNVPSLVSNWKGEDYTPSYYEKIKTRRLVYVTDIGWFVITDVVENDDGKGMSKSVTAESLESTLKDFGIVTENTVYKFYDDNDPNDDGYEEWIQDPERHNKPEKMPSVVGQIKRQLGISVNLQVDDTAPEEDYGVWTLTYVDPSLKFIKGSENSVCRTLTKKSTNGYDFLANDVQNAFEIVIEFDFLNHAIKAKTISSITEKTNIYFAFENVLKKITVTETANDLITVLTCNGNGIDIRPVNTTGSNYIVDFRYYMDRENYEWMTSELITKLEEWQSLVDAKKDYVSDLVLSIYDHYVSIAEEEEKLILLNTKVRDLEKARDHFIDGKVDGTYKLLAETVNSGEKSLDDLSQWYDTNFSTSIVKMCYSEPPDILNGTLPEDGVEDTLENNFAAGRIYFMDGSEDSYCEITASEVVDVEGVESTLVASGMKRWTVYSNVKTWLSIYETKATSVENYIKNIQNNDIDPILEEMKIISDELSILDYFANTPDLLRELKSYWFQGDYTNDNLAITESMTKAEEINLSKELWESGKKQLKKVSQPRYNFSLDLINFLGIYELRGMMEELKLGSVVTAENARGQHFEPAVTSIDFSLDNKDSFSLSFSNALRLDDWGYTYADLITEASAVTKSVTSNWRDLISYHNNKDRIENLIKEPLNRTLRLSQENMANQEFIVDDTGILGRRKKEDGEDGSFEDGQIRIMNNVLLFTDDKWETAKTALGKIVYYDDGTPKQAYGLIAEAVVGSLLLGNELKIQNSDSTIKIDANGINIKKYNGDVLENVFTADIEGNLYLKGEIEADSGKIGGFNIGSNSLYSIKTSYNETNNDGVYIGSDGIGLGKGKFYVDRTGELRAVEAKFFSHIEVNTERNNRDKTRLTQSNLFFFHTSEQAGYLDYSTNVNYQGLTTEYSGEGATGTAFASFGIDISGVTGEGYEQLDGMSIRRYFDGETSSRVDISVGGVPYIMMREIIGEYHGEGTLYGTWYLNASAIITSDINKKNSIESLSDKYSILFDNLTPMRFKYNDGASGRYHTGFIAQNLESAVLKAGLSTQEVGAFVRSSDTNDLSCGIRYEEIIALNTFEIQKLKARVAELEKNK